MLHWGKKSDFINIFPVDFFFSNEGLREESMFKVLYLILSPAAIKLLFLTFIEVKCNVTTNNKNKRKKNRIQKMKTMLTHSEMTAEKVSYKAQLLI